LSILQRHPILNALAICLLAAGLLWLLMHGTAPSAGRPTVVAAREAWAAGVPVLAGALIAPGHNIVTGPNGSLSLRWSDGTTADLAALSEMSCVKAPGIVVQLTGGGMAMTVPPQPIVLVVRTSEIEVEAGVIDTRLDLHCTPDETTVAVTTGGVRVRRPGSDRSTPVDAGQCLAGAPGLPLEPRPIGAPHGRLLRVGGGEIIPDLAALPPLQAGDVIELLPGTHRGSLDLPAVGTRLRPLIVRAADPGQCRLTTDSTTAAIRIAGGWTRVEDLTISGARGGGGAAGIRVLTGSGRTVIRGCRISGNDIGIQADGDDRLLIDGCEISGNGSSAGLAGTPNLDLACRAASVRDCLIVNAPHGVNVSIRAGRVELIRNRIGGGLDGEIRATSTNGEAGLVVLGNLITGSPPHAAARYPQRLIQIGSAAAPYPGAIRICGSTLIAGHAQTLLLDAPRSVIQLDATICFGTHLIADAATRLDGRRNWLPPGQVLPGLRELIGGADPGFVDSRNDWRLRADSPCLAAADPGQRWTDLDGIERSALPTADPPMANGRPSAQRSPGTHIGACAPAP
jgi:parallel beta-helix repeat protein